MTTDLWQSLIYAGVVLAIAGGVLAVVGRPARAWLAANAAQETTEADRFRAEAAAEARQRDMALRERSAALALTEATADYTAEACRAELAVQAARNLVAAEVAADTRQARLDAELQLIRDRAEIERALLPETVQAELANLRSVGVPDLTKAYEAYCAAQVQRGNEPATWHRWAPRTGRAD